MPGGMASMLDPPVSGHGMSLVRSSRLFTTSSYQSDAPSYGSARARRSDARIVRLAAVEVNCGDEVGWKGPSRSPEKANRRTGWDRGDRQLGVGLGFRTAGVLAMAALTIVPNPSEEARSGVQNLGLRRGLFGVYIDRIWRNCWRAREDSNP